MQVRLDDYRRAAAVATDLVNTAPQVMVSTGDGLADPMALSRFLAEHNLHPALLAEGGNPTAADLSAVHQLRDTLRELIDTPEVSDAIAQANALTTRAGVGPALHSDTDGQWHWHIAAHEHASLADELALLTGVGLLAVIRTLGHDRFRHCELTSCNGVFVDTSRGGRRRYCEPEICGARVNAANYRARRRRRPPGPDLR